MVEIVLMQVCTRYITAILLKKLTLRTEEDRRKVAKRIYEVSLIFYFIGPMSILDIEKVFYSLKFKFVHIFN